jgi:hypothetical protein
MGSFQDEPDRSIEKDMCVSKQHTASTMKRGKKGTGASDEVISTASSN